MTATDQVTNNVGKFFHSYAADFDSLYGHSKRRSSIGKWLDRKLRKTMFLRFEEALKNTAKPEVKTVLDVGCGPGRYLVEFKLQGKQATGLDMADGMIKIAQEVTDKVEGSGSVDFVESDYLSFTPDKKYDAACLMGFFDYIEKPEDIINKLKKDISKEFYASFPQADEPLSIQRRVRYKMRNCPLWLYTRKDVETILNNCGLQGKYEIKDFGRDYYVKVAF